MPRKVSRKGTPKKISAAKASKKSPTSETRGRSNKDSLLGWLKKVNAVNSSKQNFIYNSEIFEINSNSESDDCNLKELEVSLK
jgi:hypothetical protein